MYVGGAVWIGTSAERYRDFVLGGGRMLLPQSGPGAGPRKSRE